ncbi:MAG: biotin--[acetyl-CoA-carboxylase] ligase [Proteobacteria bacterium]|jgi:BirA family transcriptional regulator, biotin operon repressor / biotin---[acetyl-CoA-carboxylase] ligase|nr:biotin--[acetyl-CoA-carboxylase] ligase [Pseudomonadota bacterium]
MFDTKDQMLIEALSKAGSYLSGNELGAALNMSRVAIGKRLHALQAAGLPLQAKAATGYRLKKGFIPLAHSAILEHLDQVAAAKVRSSEIHISLDSTNAQIESIALSSGQAGFVATEVQQFGKGRRSNQWFSAPFHNIMLSLAWQFPVWPTDITAISLATGVVVAEALESEGITGLQLKWPNDLYVNKVKFGGILINIQGESGAEARINCGIGLNIKLSDNDKAKIDQPCTDLYSEGYLKLDRNVVIAKLANAWVDLCEQFLQFGFAPYTQRWHQLHLFQDQEVIARKGDKALTGRVLGADAQGCLLIADSTNAQTRLVDPDYSLKAI